jgi:hypothetical protein
MKTILLLMFCYSCAWFCTIRGEQHNRKVKNISSLIADTINYQTQIQPVLQEKCSPCHFAGGKMYERMPFDKGETIITHEAGILKRIKDEQNVALIQQYIRQKMK